MDTIKRPTIPLNAYPLATSEGRAIPIDVYRPLKGRAANNELVTFPDQINVIEVQVDTQAIMLRDNTSILMANKEPPASIELVDGEWADGVARLLPGTHLLIVGPSITVAGHCWINMRTLWQAALPTTNWRTR